jgi:NADPH:quinone reductase-like Zn-dependent oxidoreductase
MRFERVLRPNPGPSEALVKVEAAGVGPWDGWIRAGKSALPQPLPSLWARICLVKSWPWDQGFQTGVWAIRFMVLRIPGSPGTVIDFRTHRFEEEVPEVEAVIDLVGGETQRRSFQVLRRGAKLISAVSRPDQHLAQSHGVEAAIFRSTSQVSIWQRSLASSTVEN